MLTIHDSVITDQEHCKLLKDHLEKTYIEKIGFKPTLAVEKLEESYGPLDVMKYILGKAKDFELNQDWLKHLIVRRTHLDYVNQEGSSLEYSEYGYNVEGVEVKEFKGLNGKHKKVYIPNLQALKQALWE